MSDRERGIVVDSAAAAERVTDAARLLAMVLLREDARVQAAYRAWHARKLAEGATIAESEIPAFLPDILRGLKNDLTSLEGLVSELGLSAYRHWLPRVLFHEFQRVAIGADALKVTFPDDLEWPAQGRRRRAEEAARDVMWFYRVKVKRPADTPYMLGKEHALDRGLKKDSQHSTVETAIERIEQRLACISLDPPTNPQVGRVPRFLVS